MFQGLEQVARRHRREDRHVHLLHDHLPGQHHQRLHPRLGAHPRYPRGYAGKGLQSVSPIYIKEAR